MKIELELNEVLQKAIKESLEEEYASPLADMVYDIAKQNPEWWAETIVEPYIMKAFEKAFKDDGKELIKACVEEMFREWEDSFREIFEEEIRKAAVKFTEEKMKGMLK